MAHGGDIYRNKVNMDFSVNLNPLGTPAKVMEAVRNSVERAGVYPDITQQEIREIIADANGVSPESVYAGNGASELIMAAVKAVRPATALLFEPGFSGYEHALLSVDCRIKRHLLNKENGFRFSEEDIKALSEESGDRPGMIFICDPSNPTGVNIEEEILIEILDIAKERDVYVCLDESFLYMSEKIGKFWNADDSGRVGNANEFLKARVRDLITKYENLIIIRSLTKLLALPGIRMGYAISSPRNIKKMIRQLPEWNLSVCSEAAMKEGIRLIGEMDFIKSTNDLISSERSFLMSKLRNLGLKVYESDSSFILFEGPSDLYDALLSKGILIRDCSDYYGLEKGFFRIAVKGHLENEKLVEALEDVLHTF
ncbi:pyridoxal phosphate-dependent aminotransferase [Butyrivibrio sp. LC3010]|uniref:pyridoxal phosphate-dependent aminotransferase n=1 Tax=Butyrivibrio sp. LC3010 TaxID=1280680 RepID=UPI000406FC39|nr:histidinol-phosphate transaminase [Butyrivibrio sp. LC3010]